MKPVVNVLCNIRGINLVAAATMLSATGDLTRFPTPTKLGAPVVIECERGRCTSGDRSLPPVKDLSGVEEKRRGTQPVRRR
jgi:hypothetical protein